MLTGLPSDPAAKHRGALAVCVTQREKNRQRTDGTSEITLGSDYLLEIKAITFVKYLQGKGRSVLGGKWKEAAGQRWRTKPNTPNHRKANWPHHQRHVPSGNEGRRRPSRRCPLTAPWGGPVPLSRRCITTLAGIPDVENEAYGACWGLQNQEVVLEG